MTRIVSVLLCSVVVTGFVATGWGAELTRTCGSGHTIPPVVAQSPGWDSVASSPTPSGRSAIGWIADYVYLFGNEDYPGTALYWHVPTETWGQSDPCPSPGYNWAGAVAGGELYLLGRFDGTNPTNEFWKFTPDGTGGGTWTRLADYPLAVTMVAVAADEANQMIYAAGGYGVAVCRQAYVYSINSDAWGSIPSLPSPRAAAGGTFLKGWFYVLGGLDSVYTDYTNTLYEYDPESSKWDTTLRDLDYNIGFNWSSVTNDGDSLIQVGGGGGYSIWEASRYVYSYNPERDGWYALELLPVAYGTNSAVWVGGEQPYLLSTGGWRGDAYVKKSYKFLLPVGVEEEVEPQVATLNPELLQNFPNPFTSFTTIRYSVPEAMSKREELRGQPLSERVKLSLYDLSGRLVCDLVDAELRPGFHTVSWDGRDWRGRRVLPGAYFCRLTAGPFQRTKKLVTLR